MYSTPSYREYTDAYIEMVHAERRMAPLVVAYRAARAKSPHLLEQDMPEYKEMYNSQSEYIEKHEAFKAISRKLNGHQ